MSKPATTKTNLGFLGESYQLFLVKYFIETPKFFIGLANIIDQNMFSLDYLRRIVGLLKDSYIQRTTCLNYDELEIELRSSVKDEHILEETIEHLHHMMNMNYDVDVEIITSKAKEFFKQQSIIKSINKCNDIIKRGDFKNYYQIEEIIKKSLHDNSESDFGFKLFDNLEDDLKEDYRQTIPTGADLLDEGLHGGLGKGELGIIVSPMGVGKAQPYSSNVLTKNGFITMGKVKEGDYVIGCDGKEHKVVKCFEQGIRPIYRITFSNGITCECDFEHLWVVKDNFRKNIKHFNVLTLKEIAENGLYDITNGLKYYRYNIPIVKPIEFNSRPILFDAYNLGKIIVNGITKDVRETNDTTEMEWYIKEYLEHYHFNNTNHFIPDSYRYNTLEVRKRLIRGIFDFSASVNRHGVIKLTIHDEYLANDINDIVRSLGGIVKIVKKNNSYFLFISFNNKFIPFTNETLIKRYKEKRKINNKIYIENIEYVKDEKAKCIWVDSKEHTYVTDNFIVTHNTSTTTGFAANAAITKHVRNNYNGYKVLHFFFEDTEVNIRRKYYGYVTNIDACDLSKPEKKQIALDMLRNNDNEIVKMLKNNIVCQRLQSGEFTASDLKYLVKQYISRGFIPDMIILDYFECLKSEKTMDSGENEWSKEGVTMRKLESIANEFNVALWCPVQSTKDAINQEYVGLKNAGGSVKKTQIGHVIIQLAQTDEQKERGKLNIFIGKMRGGRMGRMSFQNVGFNNGTCKFDMSSMDDIDNEVIKNSNGKLSQNQMATNLSIAKML